jgi:uncharacterized protein YfiM (DUF2279 family)
MLWTCGLEAQNDTIKRVADTQKRRTVVWSVNIGLPIVVHAALYQAWYSKYPKSGFHWINDNKEWLQMDKVGHSFSGYILTISSAASFRYAGYSRKKSALLGAAVSMGFQSAIEYFDGHSAAWGASRGDLVANAAGTLFGGVQTFVWGKVKVPMRLTFRTTALASIRPELLGYSLPERLLKDYNGQTYWLDFNPYRIGLKANKWPRWLGLSAGYSAEGMLGGYSNIWTSKNGNIVDWSQILRYRQFFLSPSVALGHLRTKYKLVNILLLITDYWRIPMPTVQFNTLGVTRFHWIYW